jgi:hypothetical protein
MAGGRGSAHVDCAATGEKMQLRKIGRPRRRLWLWIGDRKITYYVVGETLFVDDETTDDSVIADIRNFYKVELWTRDDRIERMLFAGTSLDKARSVLADYARRRPAARLTIRQRSRELEQWPKERQVRRQ